MGEEPTVDGMAVLLQPVVPAEHAGVLYTAEPHTGNPWRFEVYATAGLAIDLLSGSGSGDRYTAEWDTGRVVTRHVVLKEHELRASLTGVYARAAEPEQANAASLTDQAVETLVRAGRELDGAFGARLDIEWALTEGAAKPIILQARPLVGLPVFFPARLEARQASETWTPAMATLPLRTDEPPTLLTPLYRHYSEAEMWHRYQPPDIIFTSLCKQILDVNGHRFFRAEHQPTFQEYFNSPAEYEPWIAAHEAFYRGRWDRRFDELTTIRERAEGALRETATSAQLIPALLDVMDHLWDLNAFGWSGPQALGWMCEAALRHFLEENGLSVDTPALLAGDGVSYTYRVARAQQELGRGIGEPSVIRAFDTMPAEEVVFFLQREAQTCTFLAELEAFCWRFGKTPPSWVDRPSFWSAGGVDTQIIAAAERARGGSARDVEAVKDEALARRRQAEAHARRELAGGSPTHAERLDRLLAWTRYWTRALNDRHELGVGLLWERELLWHLGSRLEHESLLSGPHEVLVLTRQALERIAATGDPPSARGVFRRELTAYSRNRRLTPPAFLGTPPPECDTRSDEAPSADGPRTENDALHVFRGRGLSGHRITGRARKVTDLRDGTTLSRITNDDVLVLPHESAFHYADWHSVLTIVRGVVSPGRPSHHLTQVARECGVALVGFIPGDLQTIPEGATLHVDGTTGVVEIG
jgi:pyruvate,water dikinase